MLFSRCREYVGLLAVGSVLLISAAYLLGTCPATRTRTWNQDHTVSGPVTAGSADPYNHSWTLNTCGTACRTVFGCPMCPGKTGSITCTAIPQPTVPFNIPSGQSSTHVLTGQASYTVIACPHWFWGTACCDSGALPVAS